MNISLGRFIRKLMRSPTARRHERVGPAHLWKMKRDFQIDFLTRHGLKPHHYLLDIGCGTLRGGAPLIAYLEEGHYYGVESRPDVLDRGRRELRRLRLESKRPVLFAAPDISSVQLEREFDYAWAFSVLFHMTDEIVEDCLRLVSGCLKAGGVFLANVNIGDAPTGNWQGFPVVYRSLAFYRERAERVGMTVADTGSLLELGHNSGDEAQDRQRMLEIRKS